MKIAWAGAALLLLAPIGLPSPAAAQGIPRGSYLNTCGNLAVRGDTLIASCRTRGGGELRSALSEFHRCVGDIGNNNGVLQCAFSGGAVARGEVVAQPGYQPPPAYQPSPAPGYDPREGERFERCRELHRRAEELRDRLEREFNPFERARLEQRLHEVHDEEERCRRY
jgi:hypothetical protein